MSLSVFVIADILHLIKIIFLCDKLFMFKKRENKQKILMMIVATMSCISIGIYLGDNDGIETIIYIVSICIMLIFLYNEKISSILISSIWIIVIMSMLDSMSVVLMDLLNDLFEYNNKDVSRIGAASVSLLVVFIFAKIYNKKYNEGIKTVGIGNILLFTLLTFVDMLIVMDMAFVTLTENQRNFRMIYAIAFILAILGIFLQLGAVIMLFIQRNVYKEKKLVTEKYLNEQKYHYEYLEKRETETKKFRHDLSNHMQLLSELAKKGNYDEFDNYLETININIEKFANYKTVQNGIVDAILNQYYSKAKQYGIEMEIKGRFPLDCAIDAYDLCTIFSNVLSNAVEAAIEADEKEIYVECRYTEKDIIIVVENTFKDEGQFGDGKIKTRKENVDYHGYGLENIRESIEKYNGMLNIKIDGSVFKLTILFNT
ncbi:MAG: GHKL domain-containing protein [Lachnospiraceae bacterium]|nr:GHKL domain-containing protein [Lachnospiraceae bacterium]